MQEGEIPALWISERNWNSWESAAELNLKIPDVCKLMNITLFKSLMTLRDFFLGKHFA